MPEVLEKAQRPPRAPRNPLVSVVIPSYNAERWLAATLHSVFAQTCRDFEVIVVDDGSTDGTSGIAEGTGDCRVRCVGQRNRGLSAARNTGIRAAAGRYIALLDADDLFRPEKLRLQVEALEADPQLGAVSCGFELIDHAGRRTREERGWLRSPVVDLRTLVFANPLLPSSLLLRREWFDVAGLFDESLARYEDWEFPIRLALEGCRIGWVKEVLLGYRRHERNMSTEPSLVVTATDAALRFMIDLFRRPDLPHDLRALEGEAIANVYIDAAARAFGAGMRDLGRDWLASAVRHDPALLEGDPPRWVVALSSNALGTLVDDWKGYLAAVANGLPSTPEFAGWNERRLRSQFFAARGFREDQAGHRFPARLSAARAIVNDPALLRNRGMVSLLLRPWPRASRRTA